MQAVLLTYKERIPLRLSERFLGGCKSGVLRTAFAPRSDNVEAALRTHARDHRPGD